MIRIGGHSSGSDQNDKFVVTKEVRENMHRQKDLEESTSSSLLKKEESTSI